MDPLARRPVRIHWGTLVAVRRTSTLLVLAAGLASCGTPWATGPSRAACGPEFSDGAPLEWSGRGNVAALGLDEADQTAGEADIYVTRAEDGVRTFCAVDPGGITVGPVPERWRPP